MLEVQQPGLIVAKSRYAPHPHCGQGPSPPAARMVEHTFAVVAPISDDGDMDRSSLPGWARGVGKVTVLTGAGISTDSGIPDFRGPNGLWTRDPAAERLSTFQAYVTDPALRRRAWQARLAHPAWSAEPNAAHTALAALARGLDSWVLTQNIDGLHQRAGTPADRVLELHGSMHRVVCISCGDRTEMTSALDRVRAGEVDPPCEQCGGVLKSATVMF